MIEVLRFTEEEFHVMADEVLCKSSDEPSFDMLAYIAEKTLRSFVIARCMQDSRLRGRDYDGDIMESIHLRLQKTIIDYFLLRDDIETPYNDNPSGFQSWLFTVASNIIKDFAARIAREDERIVNIDDFHPDTPNPNHSEDMDEHRERLKKAFCIVLSSDVKVYKVLTWIAQFLFIISDDVTKIESNDLIIEAFEKKTLYDMYGMILEASCEIPWIEVTPEQNEKIVSALNKEFKDGVTYGQSTYGMFFMKNGKSPDGKKSISDWVNRMNDIIRRESGIRSVSDTKRKKADGYREKGEKGETKWSI